MKTETRTEIKEYIMDLSYKDKNYKLSGYESRGLHLLMQVMKEDLEDLKENE